MRIITPRQAPEYLIPSGSAQNTGFYFKATQWASGGAHITLLELQSAVMTGLTRGRLLLKSDEP